MGNRFDAAATNGHDVITIVVVVWSEPKPKSLIPNICTYVSYVYVVTAFFLFVCEAKKGGTSIIIIIIIIEMEWHGNIFLLFLL